MTAFTDRMVVPKSTPIDILSENVHEFPCLEPLQDSSWGYKLYAYSSSSLAKETSDLLNSIQIAEQKTLAQIDSHGHYIIAGDSQSGLISLHVSHDMLAGETGCHQWEAGFFLSEFIFSAKNSDGLPLFQGRCCLELGSGVGMAGVALARAGAANVLCTDGDLETLENCERNLRINGVFKSSEEFKNKDRLSRSGSDKIMGADELGSPSDQVVSVQRLRWENGSKELVIPCIDIIVGADLSYDPLNIPPLIGILKDLLCGGGFDRGKALTTPNNGNVNISVKNSAVGEQSRRVPISPNAVAYIATTIRTEKTYQKFLDAVAREPKLAMENITDEANAMTKQGGGVKFCHVPSLEAARDRIVLHKITAAASL